ncbi:MAG: hypothetical protein ABEH86_09215 [Haloarcula sp.]
MDSVERAADGSRDESVDDLSDVLESQKKRHLLYCLAMYSNPMRLPDIADQLTVWDGIGREEEYLEKRLHIYNSLFHDHLPVLRARGLVRYHQAEDIVELGEAVSRIESTLKSSLEDELDSLLQIEAESMAQRD